MKVIIREIVEQEFEVKSVQEAEMLYREEKIVLNYPDNIVRVSGVSKDGKEHFVISMGMGVFAVSKEEYDALLSGDLVPTKYERQGKCSVVIGGDVLDCEIVFVHNQFFIKPPSFLERPMENV